MRAHVSATTKPGWLVLVILCLAQCMLIIDVVIVNIALPSIMQGLAIPGARLPLVSIAYTLTFGSLLIIAGRAGDLFGRRRLFLGGLLLFTVASLGAGLAQSDWQLFAARAGQGLGAAAVSPTALALLTAMFPEGEGRNRALGYWAAVGSAGAIGGQLLGGFLTDLAGWRAIFLINLPVGALALAGALWLLPESRGQERPRLDLAGALTLAAGLAALTLALARLAEVGVTADVTLGLITGAAFVLLVGFVRIERRQAAPLVRFDLFRNRFLRTGNLALALNAAAVTGALYFTTLQLQLGYGYSPLAVGLAFAPVTLIVLLISPVAGRLVGRFGVRAMLVAGAVSMGGGLLYLARMPGSGTYVADVLPGLALVALGSGLAYAPSFIAGTTGVAAGDQGLASGLLSTGQELGAALGLALLGLVAAMVTAGLSVAPVTGYRAGFLGAFAMVAIGGLLAAGLRAEERSAVATAPADA